MSPESRKDKTEKIWLELSDRLRQFLHSRIKPEADVDDVLQIVFLRIHSKLDTLHKASRLESWVFQITRNTVADFYRRKRETQSELDESVEANESDAEQARTEIAGCLDVLIEKLPREQRRALTLYEFEGVAQKDIATQESISLSGAKSRIQRARKTLEEMLKACCQFQFDSRGKMVEYEPNRNGCCDDC
ncbi:RNA polymerase sigma factor SigZ [Puniceicoccaceae bacterium K14]|nr:RNA polymerase sigma factor SigZ [Puniceicoccaceae bacterium K14]